MLACETALVLYVYLVKVEFLWVTTYLLLQLRRRYVPENYFLLPFNVAPQTHTYGLIRIYNKPFNSTHPWFDQFALIRSSHVWFPLRVVTDNAPFPYPAHIPYNSEHADSHMENQCSNSYAIKISIIEINIPYGGCNRQRYITYGMVLFRLPWYRGSYREERQHSLYS